MDLLGLVQTVIEMSKSREEYSEEVKKMRLQLDTLCSYLSDLDDSMIPNQLHEQIKNELQGANILMLKLPEKASIIHAVTSKLPFMNSLQEIKDKSLQIQQLAALLSQYLIGHLAIQQSKKQRISNNVVIEQTQIDTMDDQNQITSSGVKAQLRLLADDHVKNAFRQKMINVQEIIEVKFTKNLHETDVHKFGRSYYQPLYKDLEQISTISSEHAIIKCKRIPKTDIKPIKEHKDNKENKDSKDSKTKEEFCIPQQKKQVESQQSHQPQQQINNEAEIFYTCIDNLNEEEEQKQPDIYYDYHFTIQNIGKMGIFIYRDDTNQQQSTIPTGIWTRFTGNQIIQLQQKDKIGILMKKPEYKQTLIAYEFSFE